MMQFKRLVKVSLLGAATIGTVYSLKGNQYNVDSIGVVRLGRAAYSVFGIAQIYQKQLYALKLDKSTPEYKKQKKHCHGLAAQKLLELCQLNKGCYIKVGQHIGALDYLLPQEYVQTMRVLHNHAPTNTLEEIYQVIREEFKKEPREIFIEFDPTPLGVASLAQVHKAKLLDGRTVAVKVQHPYVWGNSKVDMKTMEMLVKLMAWIFPEFKFQWLVDETKKNLPQELDFYNEGKNAEKISEILKDFKWLKVPKIYWDLSTKRVLTMEFLEGGQVNDLEYIKQNGIKPLEITNKISRMYSQMIFVEGFVHSDPHPGNILIKKNDGGNVDIILLDHGLYAVLSEKFRLDYSQLWLSILNRDRNKMREQCAKLGIEGNLYAILTCMITGRTWDSILSGINETKVANAERDLLQTEFPNLLPQISGILDAVNRQLILVLKTNDLMRGIEYTLKTERSMTNYLNTTKCCVKMVYNDELRQSTSVIQKYSLILSQKWALFKINCYYIYRGLRTFTLFSVIRDMIVYG